MIHIPILRRLQSDWCFWPSVLELHIKWSNWSLVHNQWDCTRKWLYRFYPGKCSKISNAVLFLFSNEMLEFKNACQFSKQGRPWSDCFFWSSLIWVCTVCLGLLGRQLVYIYCISKSVLTDRQPRQRLDCIPKQYSKGIHFSQLLSVVSYLYLSKQRRLRSDYAMNSMIWAIPFCMHILQLTWDNFNCRLSCTFIFLLQYCYWPHP